MSPAQRTTIEIVSHEIFPSPPSLLSQDILLMMKSKRKIQNL